LVKYYYISWKIEGVKLKPGDKVRFLNESTEGTISKILTDEKVEVVDSHGFSHVTNTKNLVLVELVYDEKQFDMPKEENGISRGVTSAPVVKSGADLIQSLEPDHTIYAAIRLMNEKSPLTTDIELHLLNNTKYSIAYTVSRKHDDIRSGYSFGQLFPRSGDFLGIFSQDELHRFEGFEFQFLFFGKNEYKPRPPAVKSFQFTSADILNTEYRKLYYQKDDTVLLMPLYVSGQGEQVDVAKLLDKYKYAEEEKRNAGTRGKAASGKFTVLTRQKVVDLHIEELVKEHESMNNSQIIAYQLNYFMYEMDQALLNKLHKITFIHGVGNGVLRSGIREELKRFPNIRYKDAPAEKFGYGATEVEFI
jgi:hypothetical protein